MGAWTQRAQDREVELSPNKFYILAIIGLAASNVGFAAAMCAMTLGEMAAFGVLGTGFGAAVTCVVVAVTIWGVIK